MGLRGTKPQKHVSTIWSSSLAYAVGLIATDGCLSKDGRHIDFTSKDRDLVKRFCSCLELRNSIGRKQSGHCGYSQARWYYRVQFGDINFYRWLVQLGLSPRKSKTIGALAIPDKFFFDFLRGCFDGDGTIFSFWDPRWHSSFMFYTAFASASQEHLQWLQSAIKRLTGLKGRISPSTRSYRLSFAKAATRILVKKMFYQNNLPHLERKFEKIRRIFTIDATS